MGVVEGGFGIRVSDHDGVRSLTLAGELDLARVGELEFLLGECRGMDRVVVDTTALTFINSTGLSSIVDACAAGGPDRFTFIPSPMADRLLDLTRLRGQVEESLEEPLTTVGGMDSRLPGAAVSIIAQRYFPAGPGVGDRVEQFIAGALEDTPGCSDIGLVGSELAAALWRIGQTGFTVRLETSGGHIRLEVLSTGTSGIPALEEQRLTQLPLRVIEVLSDHWGLELSDNDRSIWVEFATVYEQPDEDSAVAGVPI